MVAVQPAAEPAPAAGPLRPSLRARLLRDVMVPLALVWAAGTAVVLGVASFFAQQAYDRSLLDDVYMMAANVRQALVDYLKKADNGTIGNFTLDATTRDKKVRGLIHLLLSRPECQNF